MNGGHFSGGGGGGAPESHASQHQDGGTDEISIAALSGTPAALTTHEGAADPHTGYRLESADHSHQSTGLQGGTLDAAAITAGTIATARLGSGTANNTVFLRGDQTWAAPAGGSGALARAGGNTTEATTTSTSAVDLLTASSLTIAALAPFRAIAVVRKTSGAAATVQVGAKINATLVRSVQDWSSGNNQAEDGYWEISQSPVLSNYGGGHIIAASRFNPNLLHLPFSGIRPDAQTTDVVVVASSGSGSVTTAADELHVYSYATS